MHINIDLQTLSFKTNAIVLSIGAVAFDFNQPKTFDTLVETGFYKKLDASAQKKIGRHFDLDCLNYWKHCPVESKSTWGKFGNDADIVSSLNDLNEWAKDIGYSKQSFVFCRGNYFDIPILMSLYDDARLEPFFINYRSRDINTFIDTLAGTIYGKYAPYVDQKTNSYNALECAADDVCMMQEVFNLVMNEE